MELSNTWLLKSFAVDQLVTTLAVCFSLFQISGFNLRFYLTVDWWSFGVLVYELLTGASPFTVDGERNTQQEISRRILRANPPFPNNLSDEVLDLLKLILVKDPHKRLGGSSEDADEIKRHPFFKSINWDDLAARRVPAPFTPKITSELDVSNFADEFTSMVPKVSVLLADNNNNPNSKQTVSGQAPSDQNGNDDLSDDDLFYGYSYVAPSVVLDDVQVLAQNSNSAGCVAANALTNQTTNGNTTAAVAGNRFKPDIAKLVAASKSGSLKNEFFKNYQLVPGPDCTTLNNFGWLGDGSFSVCCRCLHKQSGAEYAVKIVSRHRRRDSVNGTLYDASLQEEQLLRACQGHLNIVALKEVFQDESHTFFVLELLRGGELLSRIRKRTRFTEAEARDVFRRLVSAVGYLHSKGIVHRDLKPEVCVL